MRADVDYLFREGQLLGWGVPATGVLVETLLDRSADGDVAEAEAAISGWRTRQPTTDWSSAKSGCCGCGHCWRGHVVTTMPTATIGIATARWPKSLASRGTWR